MRVLVCGGRDYDLRQAAIWLNRNIPLSVSMVIHGGARGADTGADMWAKLLGLPLDVYPADWTRYRMAAVPVRNAKMLKEGKPDLVIAFPGGKGRSSGHRAYESLRDSTKDMVQRANYAGMPIRYVPEERDDDR